MLALSCTRRRLCMCSWRWREKRGIMVPCVVSRLYASGDSEIVSGSMTLSAIRSHSFTPPSIDARRETRKLRLRRGMRQCGHGHRALRSLCR